jgi:hypothetical protein
VGQQITFQLMTRERGSLLACPVSQFEVRTKQKPVLNVSERQLDTAFAKLLTANKNEVGAYRKLITLHFEKYVFSKQIDKALLCKFDVIRQNC